MPKVSVIIPVYNVESYLRRSMDSVCSQTLEDIEIICINDASTDNSLAILREYEQKDKRVKVIDLEENSGAAAARNKGLDAATGEYLGFVDPDDEIVLNFYEELYKKVKEEDADIVKCKRKNINVDGKVSYTKLNNIIKKKGKYYFTYEWQSAIYRHQIITENNIHFPEECRVAEDIVFLNEVLFKSDKFVLIDNVEYLYYKRDGSLHSKKIPLESIKSALKAKSLQVEILNASDLYEKDKKIYIELFFHKIYVILSHTLYQNDSIETKRLCAQSIIDTFYKCKDTQLLEEVFKYKHLLPLIKKKNVKGLTNIIKHYKCPEDALQKPLTLWQKMKLKILLNIKKIFSVENVNVHKVITILGIKFKFKSKKLEYRMQLDALNKKIDFCEKTIMNLKQSTLKTNQIAAITELAMLKTKYHWDNIKIPVINNNYETVKALKETNKSIIRFGNGDFDLLEGNDMVYQNYQPYIAETLKEIIKTEDEDLLIGIPEIYYDITTDLIDSSQNFILTWFSKWHKIMEKYYNYNKSYYSTHISQSFPVFANYDFETLYSDFMEIWNNKKIAIVTGDRVYNNIEYNIFDNASEISYIYGPTVNAFDKYEELKSELINVSKDNILIFALGPAGKVLAYDMYKLGYRVLDLGHLIKDYDFYRKSVSMTKEEWNQYRKAFFKKD